MINERLQFLKSLDEFKVNVEKRADKVFKTLSHDVLQSLLAASPIRTGNFRAHWRVSRNARSKVLFPRRDRLWEKMADVVPIPRAPAEVWVAGTKVIERIKFGDTVHFSNNTEYADFLAA